VKPVDIHLPSGGAATLLRRALAVLLTAVLALALYRYPFAKLSLVCGFLFCAWILCRFSGAWLIVVPALLPVFDLAPWSGWFFFDELDFVVMLTLLIGLWQNPPSCERRAVPHLLWFGVLLLATSYLVSLVIGLFPLEPLDANAFSNYYSRYNSVRMSKGFAAALALFALFLHRRPQESVAARYLVLGMVLGVAGTVVAVIWERFRFSGLFEFASDFRVTAIFSGMHNGGNDLEAYLVLAQPFVVAWMILQRSLLSTVGGAGLLVLSAYSLLVSYSRAGLLAMVVNGIILAVALPVSLRSRHRLLITRALLMGLVIGAVVLSIGWFVVGGRYFQARLERTKMDWNTRVRQSQTTIEMMDTRWFTTWFGMGLGRYPALVYERNPLKNRPAAYRFESEGANTYLRLYPGNRLYFGQWISGVKPATSYRLSFNIRSHGQGALSAYLCEKTLQYSFQCASKSFTLAPMDGWSDRTTEIETGTIGAAHGIGGWLSVRPVEVALSNASKEAVFDVDNVKLVDSSGKNLLVNPDFQNGMDRWFFTVDDHTPWQNWNHWVHLYFEQGWFGVLSFLFFVSYVIGRLIRQIYYGNWLATIGLAAVSSFLTVGVFGYLFDTPRMALIYFLVALVFGQGLSAPLIGANEVKSLEST
jgi:hypothetical protein